MFEAQFVSLSMPGIIKMVCRYYGIDVNHLAAKQRTLLLVRPRQIVMYLAKEHTHLSLPQIATRLDRMDHTTVLYGVRRIKQLMETDIRLAAEVENFERDLGCYRA
jgi:chromosomal replication initiator protein